MKQLILAASATLLLSTGACEQSAEVECTADTDCNLEADGVCAAACTGSKWCLYPEVSEVCPSGQRWSDFRTGDGLAGACFDANDSCVAGDAGSDAPTDAGVDAASPITWGEMQLLASLNSDEEEFGSSVSSDGLELYFNSNRIDGSFFHDIFVSTRTSTVAAFGPPTPIAAINTPGNGSEAGPEISSDGLELFFSRGSFLFRSTRLNAQSPWSAPVDQGIVTGGVSISGDALSIYFIRSGETACGRVGPCVKKRSRPAIGGAWGSEVLVPLPAGMQYRSVDVSSDELALLVSSPGIAGQAVVMQGFRATTNDDFQNFEQIPTLNVDLENTKARWNKQETEIYLTSNRVIDGSDFDLYVVLPTN